jgi:mannose-1-phosphate guanylyltransferase
MNYFLKRNTNFLPGENGNSSLYAIILSAGEGAKFQPVIQQWIGDTRPKQYCSFFGRQSLVRQTINRAKSLVPVNNIYTVIGSNHRMFIEDNQQMDGHFIEQPVVKGNATSLYLGLSHILQKDPNATVMVFPADHFIHPEEHFLFHMYRAAAFARCAPELLYLMGAVPDSADVDYGWLKPDYENHWDLFGDDSSEPLRIDQIYNNPNRQFAEFFFDQGYYWNTMIFTAAARTLDELGRKSMPELMENLDVYQYTRNAVKKGECHPNLPNTLLEQMYEEMDTHDICTTILKQFKDTSAIIPMNSVDWNEWDKPERVMHTFYKYNLNSTFKHNYYNIKNKQYSA